jgi:glucose/arabinose dehydrogenase
MINADLKMKSKLNIPHLKILSTLSLALILLMTACSSLPPGSDDPTPTIIIPDNPTATFMAVCTPPACGDDEAYSCPDECPGGCGTVCATHTPEADGQEPEAPTRESVDLTPETESPTIEDESLTSEGESLTSEGEGGKPSLPSVETFPDPSGYPWVPVVSGLKKPLSLTHAGDGSGRLFVIEQPGRIRVIQDMQLLDTPFLDIQGRVEDGANEQGLLGLAFHPDYEQNGTFYLNYTGKDGATFISQFKVADNGVTADPGSEKIILQFKQPFGNHNGGHLLFGPDGNLYIGTGDGGSGGDPEGNAQNPNSLLGKMLRIDVDHGDPYAVPADNPFVQGGGRPEIWAVGLRNPWRYSFDRLTGDLYIADVGQNQWEEINFAAADRTGVPPAGINFGWDYWEASHPFEGIPPDGIPMMGPIWEYGHELGCSVTGGLVYRGSLPAWQGVYFYADYCKGTVWGLLRGADGAWVNQILVQTGATVTAFGEDEAGELYLVDRSGEIFRMVKSP